MLTNKQAAFVSAYRIDPNRKMAAIIAGYRPESAAIEACRLLKSAKILEAIAKPPLALMPAELPPHQEAVGHRLTPLEYMLRVMNDPGADDDRRDSMARAAAPFVHGKVGEGGKKDAKQEAAKVAASGRFGAPAPPKLTLVR